MYLLKSFYGIFSLKLKTRKDIEKKDVERNLIFFFLKNSVFLRNYGRECLNITTINE